MNEKELRKQLTIMVYSFIFKRILPTMDGLHKIGNPEYAKKLNFIIRKRAKDGYTGTVFDSFDLTTPHTQTGLVMESNFNNWVNGTSNPKSYGIINAILEFLYEICESEDKLIQLRIELSSVISAPSFDSYTDNLIVDIIEDWKKLLKDSLSIEDILRLLKDVLYLLKDKNRHISYLLHQKHVQNVPDVLDDILSEENDPSELMKSEETSLSKSHVRHFKSKKVLLMVGCLVFLFIILGFYINTLSQSRFSTATSGGSLEMKAVANFEDSSIAQAQTPEMKELALIPTAFELTPPHIISPLTDTTLTYEPIQVKWEKVDIASSYDVSLKEVRSDTIVFEKKEIFDSYITIDPSYILCGLDYKLYVVARKEQSSSEASYIVIHTESLSSPEITSPINGSTIKRSDIELTWTPILGTDSYNIIVTDTERWIKVFEKNNITTTSMFLEQSIFMPGVKYRIYISAQNRVMESTPNYVDVHIQQLDAATLISPTENTDIPDDSLHISWKPVDLASSYKIDILETNTWETVFTKEGITKTSIDIDTSWSQLGGQYRIYLFSMLDTSSSKPVSLDIKASELLPPTITYPSNNLNLPLDSFEVRWLDVPNVDDYSVVVTDTVTWESVYNISHVEGESVLIDKSVLDNGSTYRIYVKSNAGSLVSSPSYIDISINALSKPVILTPEFNTKYQDQDIYIKWTSSEFITTYKITISDLSTWETIYSNETYTSEDILLNKSLFQKGGSYRIYVQSVIGIQESEPAIIDFSLLP